MTQKQMLRQLLEEFKIPWRERTAVSHAYPSEEGVASVSEWETSVDLLEGAGLPGHVTSFYFDSEEAFLAHRSWKTQ